MAKVIFHIDMDAFFVSCERSKNENLKNKPVVIALNSRRAIISAMSYEVKKQGFKSGDPLFKVRDKIKDLIVISPHYQLYSLMSKKIFNFIKTNYSNMLEVYSIDECYLDVTNNIKKNGNAIDFARKIQNDILNVFDIPCSIGISYTKFLAKMSTNKAKPFGILETKKEDIKKHFYDLGVEKIFGIGKANSKKIISYNIKTWADLVNCDNDIFLRSVFGKNYFKLVENLKGINTGIDHIFYSDAKSISNSKTFITDDSSDRLFLLNELKKITQNVCLRASDANLEAKQVSVMLRRQNKIWISKNKSISTWTSNFDLIWKNVELIFDSLWDEEPLRGLGVSIGNLRTIFNSDSSFDILSSDSKNMVEKIINEQNFINGNNLLKTLYQYSMEKNINTDNIKFLRKNSKTKNKRISLED
ncbi:MULTISPECIES: Y-family DNA polymerase [unclassified Mycoplasma]